MSADKAFRFNPMGTGFTMTFKNGWTISVQTGPHTYSDHKRTDFSAVKQIMADEGRWQSNTAEVAAWDAKGRWYGWVEGDEVMAHVTADKVAECMEVIASLPEDYHDQIHQEDPTDDV